MNKLLENPFYTNIVFNYDIIIEKLTGIRSIHGKKYGVSFTIKKPNFFFCPHCKTENINNIKEIKIDGEPEIKSIAHGYGYADTRYGKSYLPIMDGAKSREYPVSVKFYCENCRNEHTKPELMKALNERDLMFERKMVAKKQEIYEKLRSITRNEHILVM